MILSWIEYGVIIITIFCITVLLFHILLHQKWIFSLYHNHIRDRDIHTGIKPKIGGIVIIPLFVLCIGVCVWTGILVWQPEFWGMIMGAIGILLYGYIDEKYDLPWSIQFLWQFGIAGIIIGSGIGIQALNLPNGGLWFIDTWQIMGLVLPRDIITALWIVGLMNVVNWLDGIDGLAGGVGIIGFVTLFILGLTPFVNQGHIALFSAILIALYAGFLRFNWYPSKIFLGTYGSMFLGYMLAILSLISGGKIATSALVLAFPIIDAAVVIISRIWNKKSIFEADNNHFHHKLLNTGLTEIGAVRIMYVMSILFAISALVFDTAGKMIVFSLGAIILIGVSAFLTRQIAIRHKK